MANNVILDAGRVVTAAIMLTENNGLRFNQFGATAAALSPALEEIRRATDPVRASAEGRLSTPYSGGTIFPTVEVKYKPAKAATGIRNSRSSQTAGTAPTNGASTTITYNQHIEKDFQLPILSVIAKEQATREYVQRVLQGAFDTSSLAERHTRDMLSDLGMEMLRELNSIIPTINNNTLTTLLGAVGKNKAFPTVVTPSAAAPFPTIDLWDENLRFDRLQFFTAIRQTQLQNKFVGRPLLVGGTLLSKYMDWAGVQSINAEGLVQSTAMQGLGFDWYYDENADTIFGQDKIVMFDSGAFCMNTFPEHDPVIGIVNGRTQVDNVFYGQVGITIPQFATNVIGSAANNVASMSMNWDVRIKESLDAQDLPVTTVTPSLKYGYFKRPLGYFTSVSADVLSAVTGVFGFQLRESAPIIP
jgi:hypothetical protein